MEKDSEGLNDAQGYPALKCRCHPENRSFWFQGWWPFSHNIQHRGVWNAEIVSKSMTGSEMFILLSSSLQICDSVRNVYLTQFLLMQRISVHSCSRITYPWGKAFVIVNNYLFLLTFFVPLPPLPL